MSLTKKVYLTISGYDIKLSDNLMFYQNDQLKLIFYINEYGIDYENNATTRALMPVNPLNAILFIENPDGVDSVSSAKIEDNAVTFYLDSTHTQYVGVSRMQLRLFDQDGCAITLPHFTFEIRENIYGSGDVRFQNVVMVDQTGTVILTEDNDLLDVGDILTMGTEVAYPQVAKTIKELPIKHGLDGTEKLIVEDNEATKQAPLGTIVDEIKQNSQEKIREIESELAQTNAQLSTNIIHAISRNVAPNNDVANDLNLLISEAIQEKKIIKMVPGIYKLSSPLKINGSVVIEAYGVELQPSDNYNGNLVELTGGREITIRGLKVNGLYRANCGIKVDTANEFLFHNVKIWNCFKGVILKDTYYGEFSGECTFIDNYDGIVTQGSENNTIALYNTRIIFNIGWNSNDTTGKSYYYPKNNGESDEDYFTRVPKVHGIKLESLCNNLKISGIIIEKVDNGLVGMLRNVGGTETAHITINDCYFENIWDKTISLKKIGSTEILWECTIENNRFFQNHKIELGSGRFTIKDNQQLYGGDILLNMVGTYRTQLYTDLPDNRIKYYSDNNQISVNKHHLPLNTNFKKYNPYGNVNGTYQSFNHLPTILDEDYISYYSHIREGNAMSKAFNVKTVMDRPLTFSKAGIVVKGENNKYYMLTTNDGTDTVWREVSNIMRLEEPINSMTAKELYRYALSGELENGDYRYCVDLGSERSKGNVASAKVTVKNGKLVANYGTSNEYVCIGKGTDIPTSAPYIGCLFWNVEIDLGYQWNGNYWVIVDWYGKTGTQQMVGTATKKPNSVWLSSFINIYYATDEDKYYEWDGNIWNEFERIDT